MVSEAARRSNRAQASTEVAERLSKLRARMRERGIDAVIVRATDAYLNEYVPEDESLRVYVTGFSGSMGDALITRDRAILFVDGRYVLQAEQEAPDFERREVPLGQPIESGWLEALGELSSQGVRVVGVETDRVPVSLMKTLTARADEMGLSLTPTVPSLVAEVRHAELGKAKKARGKIWHVGRELSGRSVKERLVEVAPALSMAGVDGFVVIPLDELAWIANLRGDHFPYQATFRAQAVIGKDRVFLAADEQALLAGEHAEEEVRFVGEGGLEQAVRALLAEKGSLSLGYAEGATPEAVRASLEGLGVRMVPMESPFSKMRTTKTRAELEHMATSFRRADEVVRKVQLWLSSQVSRGATVTEADVAKRTLALFKRSGAWGLSFKVIPAAGRNGAVIHYSKPDAHTSLKEGQMFLLDTGAYYEGGYATDLTRTFLIGKGHVKASDEQKKIFTVVLKGAIAGMSARIPKGSTGEQLDAIVRDPIWRAGYNYGHGTGHGVGVNVHEFPPRVAPGVRWLLEAGQVFSIEPGIYLSEFGGVRIENLVTLVKDPDDARFLRVKPLTFSPLDKRLIDKALLSAHEKAFLDWFAAQAKVEARLEAPLPPLS